MSETLAFIAAAVWTLAFLPIVALAGLVVSLAFRARRTAGSDKYSTDE